MRDVAIIGVGMTKWGELWEKSLRRIWAEAALAALEDAGVDKVDLITVGCMSPGLFVGQEHLGSLLADEIGMAGVAAARVETACASGGLALRVGIAEVASGLSDIVLVTGVEKMTDVDTADATYALGTAADQEYEAFHGVTFPGLYAMMARAHMERYGTTSRQLASVAVKNHTNALDNPYAQYHLKITVEDVLSSTMVADPLHVLDCSPITDGAAAVVIAPLDEAKKLVRGRPLVKVSGSGLATDSISLAARDDLTKLAAVEKAAQRAYKMAGRSPSDVQVAEVHDCFTIAEIMVMEALGFFAPGEAAPAIEDGYTARDGKLPVNTSGGLKAKGHPVGATGVAQVVEVTLQLWGEAGKRQVSGGPTVGLCQTMGGSGGSAVVHVLEVVS